MRRLRTLLVLMAALAQALVLPGPGRAGDLNFVPDTGARLDPGYLPYPYLDPASGTVYMWYTDDNIGTTPLYASSADGLSFTPQTRPTSYDDTYPLRVQMPDPVAGPVWRIYEFDHASSVLTSQTSADGVHFFPGGTTHYAASALDYGSFGVFDTFADAAGVTLLYVGDLGGLNNVRRAYSADNGETFTFDTSAGTNLLGDEAAGGGNNSLVDPRTILLPDGRRRVFTMRGGGAPGGGVAKGEILSAVSSDGGQTFVDEGVRLDVSDFTDYTVYSFHDPFVVALPDGRYRMYVAGRVTDDYGANDYVILSATTSKFDSGLLGFPDGCLRSFEDCYGTLRGPQEAYPIDTSLRPLPGYHVPDPNIIWCPPRPEPIPWDAVELLGDPLVLEPAAYRLPEMETAVLSLRIDVERLGDRQAQLFRLDPQGWVAVGGLVDDGRVQTRIDRFGTYMALAVPRQLLPPPQH